MEAGGVVSGGKSFCSAASTACKSSSKNAGSFIVWKRDEGIAVGASRFVAFRIERFGGKFAVGFFEQNFHLAFGFFELLLAFTRKRDAFFKQLHGFVERKLRAFEFADDFLEPCQRALEFRLFRRFRFFRCWIVHAVRSFLCRLRFCAFTSDSFCKNKSTAHPVRFARLVRRIARTADLRDRMQREFSRVLRTTNSDRENRAPDANNILRHGEERTQLLYEGWRILWL